MTSIRTETWERAFLTLISRVGLHLPVVNKAQAVGMALNVLLGGITIHKWDQLDVHTISERE
jgi:hypothetical protein